MEETASSDCFKVNCYFPNEENCKDELSSADAFIENQVHNQSQNNNNNVSSVETNNLESISSKTQKAEATGQQIKTMDNAYHLITSIISVCDDEEANFDALSNGKVEEEIDIMDQSETHVSRWSSMLHSLQTMPDSQCLLGGKIRVSCRRKRITYVISSRGKQR